MATFRVSLQARADLVNIWIHIADDSTGNADQLRSRFHDAFARLAEFPHMGRRRSELAPELRSFPVRNYMIFYRPTANGIGIIRVLHVARDIESQF